MGTRAVAAAPARGGGTHGHAEHGLPTGFEARAAEDTLCYRVPADVIGPLLARPDFLRFIARSIVGGRTGGGERVPPADPVQRPVETLIRTPPLVCSPGEPIREAAKRMTADRASAILVRSGGSLGIVTDYDLRSRVVAAGVSPDTPVSAIMSAPAHTVGAGSLVGDVLLDMLDRGVHHVPVLSAAGEVLGVVDGGDLIAAEARGPFLLRRAIDLATSAADLAAASAGLDPMIICGAASRPTTSSTPRHSTRWPGPTSGRRSGPLLRYSPASRPSCHWASGGAETTWLEVP
jgi:CBS domain-containing protein